MKAYRLNSGLGVLSGLGIESVALYKLPMSFLSALILHGFACILMVIALYLFLSKHFVTTHSVPTSRSREVDVMERPKQLQHFNLFSRPFYGLLYGLSFVIPLCGMLLSILIVYLIFQRNQSTFKYAEAIDTDINLNMFKTVAPKYGSGGVMMHLFDKKETSTERTKALFILGQLGLASINPYIIKLLPDESDEMRLLAFNILDEEESKISLQIQKLEHIYTHAISKKIGDTTLAAKTSKDLAILYWELVFRHLILPELELDILEKSLFYVQAALKGLAEDARLWGLLGKINNKLKRYDDAEVAFQKALQLNIPASQALPYLAEIQYVKKNYHKIPPYLKALTALEDIAFIYPVKQFWCEPHHD